VGWHDSCLASARFDEQGAVCARKASHSTVNHVVLKLFNMFNLWLTGKLLNIQDFTKSITTGAILYTSFTMQAHAHLSLLWCVTIVLNGSEVFFV